MTLLAGIAVLLRRYTGEEDLILGTVFSGRNRPELSSLIGFFMNTVPLRVDLTGAPDFRAVQSRVREAVLAAYAHQDVPFPKLAAELFPGSPADRTILFRVLLNTLDFPVGSAIPASGAPSAPALIVETLSVFEDEAKYDLLFTAQEGPGRVRCDLLGALDVFEAESVDRIRKDFEDLLRQAAKDPEAPLDALVPSPRWAPESD
jgi:non-ribosomal peptide synthetase component F